MSDHPDGVFGPDVAPTYDRDHGNTPPEELARTVNVLQDLAAGGPILEFAIGTGRAALPLAEMGCDVKGIELSAAMIAELRKKAAGRALDVVQGDMSEARIDGDFSLVFLIFNTLDNLTTQEAQVACFCNAAAHLAPGGRFVVETLVPPVQKLPFGETLHAFAAEPGHIGTDEIDVVNQTYTSHHVWRDEAGAQRALSVPFRYAWPAEQDLMARIAGMTLEHRWSDWKRAAFTRHSTAHISVWRKPE